MNLHFTASVTLLPEPNFIHYHIFCLIDNAEWTLFLGVARKFLFLSFFSFLPSFYVVVVFVGARVH